VFGFAVTPMPSSVKLLHLLGRRRRNGHCNRRSGTRGREWRGEDIFRWDRADANERFPHFGNEGIAVW